MEAGLAIIMCYIFIKLYKKKKLKRSNNIYQFKQKEQPKRVNPTPVASQEVRVEESKDNDDMFWKGLTAGLFFGFFNNRD